MGDGVNIASRLEGVAAPGGICLSEDAYRQVRRRLDLFTISAKPISRTSPSRSGFIRFGRAPARQRRRRRAAAEKPRPHAPDKPSIAVLPFQNMSGDPEQEYFADGMVEDIITGLSRIKWLFVIARNSSFVYKGKAVDIRQIGRELGVRYVLEGASARRATACAITAQLIEAETGVASLGREVRRCDRRRFRPPGPNHRTRSRHGRTKPATIRNRAIAAKTPRKSRCL